LKKYIYAYTFLLFSFLFATAPVSGQTLYWIGGGGDWNDPFHWSHESGGSPVNAVPGPDNDVVFDEYSFEQSEKVEIKSKGVCRNFYLSPFTPKVFFEGSELNISGSFQLESEAIFDLKVGIVFLGKGSKEVNFNNIQLNSNLTFNGRGEWILEGGVFLLGNKFVEILNGNIIAKNFQLKSDALKFSKSATGKLVLDNSIILLGTKTDFTNTGNFSIQNFNSQIFFNSGHLQKRSTITGFDTIVTPVSCNSSAEGPNNDGSILITGIIGGIGPFKIEWTGGHLGSAIFEGNFLEGCLATAYLVTITDLGNPGADPFQDFISVPSPNPLAVSNYQKTIPICFGDCNGSVRVNPNVNGGTAPFTFLWDNGQTGQTTTNRCASNNISVTITDAKGCSRAFQTTLLQPKQINPNATISQPILCFGDCNGAIITNAQGGVGTEGDLIFATGGYTYSWSPGGQTTSGISNLCAGVYTVTVRDTSNCEASQIVTITSPDSIRMNPQSTMVSCFGANDGKASVAPSGGTPGYNYTWTASVPGTFTGSSLSNLAPGTYTVLVTDNNGCSKSHQFIITQPDSINFSITGSHITCFGFNNGSAAIVNITGGTGPYNYSWNTTPVQTTISISGLTLGTYTATVTDANGCNFSKSIVIEEPPQLLVNAVKTDMSCFGLCNGSASAAGSAVTGGTPPYTYSWNTTPVSTNPSITDLCKGIYIVTVTDARGCIRRDTVEIIEPPVLTVSVEDQEITCAGRCDGILNAVTNGGTPGYTYSWSSGQTTSSINNLCLGTYTVTVTDSRNCTAIASASITSPQAINPNLVVSNVTCYGLCNGTATSNPTGGTGPYTYLWNSIPAQTLKTATGLCAGTYTVRVTDIYNCWQDQTFLVTQPDSINITTHSLLNVDCFGNCTGQATINVSGATPFLNAPHYNITWNTNPLQTGLTVNNLCAGTYTANIVDALGCTYPYSINITQPEQLLVTATSENVKCFGACDGTALATATGGYAPYNYTWLTTPNQSGSSVGNLCPGTYMVRVLDDRGCKDSTAVTITQPLPLTAELSNTVASCNTICNGTASVVLGGGTPGYSYLWSPSNQTGSTATGLCVGEHSVTITDGNNCNTTIQLEIEPLVNIIVNSNGVGVTCFGACDAQATATAFGGAAPYTYTWLPSNQVGQIAYDLCAGTHTVQVVDADGCSHSAVVTFSTPSPITFQTSIVDATCGSLCDGSASATAFGGTGTKTYSWNTQPPQNTQNATQLCQGEYVVTATDVNGCIADTVVFIDAPSSLDFNLVIEEPTCSFADGQILLQTFGGQAPYSYQWSNGQTSNPAINLAAGVYWVKITDAIQCTDSFNIILNDKDGPIMQVNTTTTTCPGDCDGTASAEQLSGNPLVSYLWTPGGANSNQITGCEGQYFVTVTDVNGCISSASGVISEPFGINPNATITNVNCFGFCNGSIVLNPSGGNGGPYTFLWSNGSTANARVNLCPGNYSVTIVDAKGCLITEVFTVGTINVINANPQSKDVSCNGACNGFAGVNPTGGQPPYSFYWFPTGSNSPGIVEICSGSYQVTITDANGCTANQSFTIVEASPLSALVNKTDNLCSGNCSGSAAVTPSGGSGFYTYFWTGTGEKKPSVNNLCAGTYTMILRDSLEQSCSISIDVNITEPLPLVITLDKADILCNNQCNGSIAATVTGGTGPYTYLWNNGQTNPFISGLCAGTYTLTVTDANGCIGVSSLNINQPLPITLNLTSQNNSCFESCNGAAQVNPSGGTGQYSINWNSPVNQTTNSVSNLCAGNYTVQVRDENLCLVTQNFTITQPTEIKIDSIRSTPASCGVCDGNLQVFVSGGIGSYNIVWDDSAAQTGSTVNNLCAGLYNATITDQTGCSEIIAVALSNDNGPLITVNNITPVNCYGGCNGSAAIQATGLDPLSYLWLPSGGTGTSANNLCAGIYHVRVMDNLGCISFQSIEILEPDSLILNLNPEFVSIECASSCNGVAQVSPVGGTPAYSYSWSNGSTSNEAASLCAGTHSVQVTDQNNCIASETFTLTAPSAILVSRTVTNVKCNGFCDGSATLNISGGSAPYTINWPNGNITVTLFSSTMVGLCPGNYSVQITDATGCVTTTNFNIAQPNVLTLNSTKQDITCNGFCNGRISISPVGGTAPYSVVWSNGITGNVNNNLCPGIYSVTLTDANNCSVIQSFTITQPASLTASLTGTNITCYEACDATGKVNAAGGTQPYYYLWTPGGHTTETRSNLCPGNYSILVLDSNGCSFTAYMEVIEPNPILTNETVVEPPCNICSGAVEVAPSGGSGAPYLVEWSTGEDDWILEDLCAGLYYVTITDQTGCSREITIPISNSDGPELTVSQKMVSCFGKCDGAAKVIPTTGTPAYSFQWLPNQSSSDSVFNLCEGTYYSVVTDADGCISVATVLIEEPSPIFPNITVVNTSCGTCEGSAFANSSGGTPSYNYLWSTGSSSGLIDNLCAGIYAITISDANGCTVNQNVNIGNNDGPQFAAQVNTDVSCFGLSDGSSTLIPFGGLAPYSYLWIPINQSSNPITNLSAGDYTAQIIDANNCFFSVPVSINGPDEIKANPVFVFPDCGVSNGSITINPSGGAGGYSFVWSNGSISNTISNIPAGIYTVTILDASGCTQVISIPLNNSNGPIIYVTELNDIDCFGNCSGSATLSAANGSGNFNYLWFENGSTTPSVSGLCKGEYTVAVTDILSGCISFESIEISEPLPLAFAFPSVIDVSCLPGCDGSATVFPTGGTLPYVFEWSTGDNTQKAVDLCEGIHIVTVTDSNGCKGGQTVIVESKEFASLDIAVTPSACGSCDGIAIVNVPQNSGPYTYQWSSGHTTDTATGLCAGIYTVEVTDGSGCITSHTVLINNLGGVNAVNISVTNASCFGVADGAAIATPVGGIEPYTYLWLPLGTSANEIINVSSGVYYLEVVDAEGCKRISEVNIGGPTEIKATAMINNSLCSECTGSVLIIPSGGTGNYSYNWSNGESTAAIYNLCAEWLTVTVTDQAGCSEEIYIPVNDVGAPIVSVVSTNLLCAEATICNGTLEASASGGSGNYNFVWVPSGETTTQISNLCAGSYYVQVTDGSTGCKTMGSGTINNPPPLTSGIPQITNAFCGGECTGIATVIPNGGVMPYTIIWDNGSVGATGMNLCAGTHIATITDFNGCSINQSINISEPPTIFIDVKSVVPPQCSNTNEGAIDIDVTGGTGTFTYQWSGGSDETTKAIENLYIGSYTITVTDASGCEKSETINLDALVEISADAGTDTVLCGNTVITLSASGGNTFEWYNGDILIGSEAQLTINPNVGTHTYILITRAGTCIDSDTITVTVNNLPLADAGPDQVILYESGIVIGGNPSASSGSTIQWLPSEGLNDATNGNPYANPLQSTTYIIQVTDIGGCVAVDSMRLTVLPRILFPNGITPNGDGLNDTWIIDNIIFFPEAIVEVYSRWGELLFRSAPGYPIPWDGRFNGKELPVGTYYYIINLHDERFEVLTGPITIMK
jgi:gliding motility-associated-like protein